MATLVEYILNLKDNLSKGLEGANVRVKELESTLGTVNKLLGVFGVSMAAYEGFEFLKGAHEAWEKLEQSTAKVSANLKSTGGAAGVGMDEIEEMATSLSSHIKATKGEVMDMQSQLLTFPSITKAIFKDSMGMVADIAAQTTHGLSQTGIMFGKAFADPEKGLNKLVRYGVMLTEKEQDRIVKLEESGHLIAAQKLMLETIAHSGYSGVATEMFNADAGAQYEKSLYNVRIEVGELVDKLQRELMPVALEFLKWVKSSVDWIKEHASMLQSLAVGIGVAAAAFYTLNFVQILLLGIENALVAAAVSGASFGTAMLASLGPVALMATAIGGLAMAFSMLGENIEKAKAERNKFLEDSNTKETTYLEELAKSEGGGQKGINAAAAKEKASLQATLKDLQHQMDNSSTERGTEINKQITETLGKINTVDRFQLGLVPKKNGFKNPDGMGKAADKEPKTKATGSKSVTINVSIKDLIGTYNMNVTNIKEMGNNIREHVVAALVSATNDFQLATGQ